MSRGANLSSLRMSILMQVANALSYLHAKDIIHGRLSSQNIFLENKVLVSMLDYAPTTLNLQYCPPEIGRVLNPDTFCSNPAKTKAGDVFSFGTLIYLLFIGRLPFDDLVVPELLSRVSSGHFPSLLLSMNSNLALIIRWNVNYDFRVRGLVWIIEAFYNLLFFQKMLER